MKYDLIVVGAGPSGLSACINAKILNLNVLLVGDSLGSKKTWSAPKVLNYLGLPNIDGKSLNDAFVNHFNEFGVEFLNKRIHGIYKMQNEFMVDAGGEFLTAKSVILACGVNSLPSIKGEDEFLGKGVSYCATCDAPLLKNKVACVIGYDQESLKEAEYIASICDKVYFVPMAKFDDFKLDKIEVIQTKPIEFVSNDGQKATTLKTDKRDILADGFFVLKQLSADKLMVELEMKDGHVVVDKNGKTNVKGVFACGDLTGKPYKYSKSVGEGLVCAFAVEEYLKQQSNG